MNLYNFLCDDVIAENSSFSLLIITRSMHFNRVTGIRYLYNKNLLPISLTSHKDENLDPLTILSSQTRVRDLAFLTAYNTSQSESKPKTITASKKNDFNDKFLLDKSCPTIFHWLQNWELNFSYRRKKIHIVTNHSLDLCKNC